MMPIPYWIVASLLGLSVLTEGNWWEIGDTGNGEFIGPTLPGGNLELGTGWDVMPKTKIDEYILLGVVAWILLSTKPWK